MPLRVPSCTVEIDTASGHGAVAGTWSNGSLGRRPGQVLRWTEVVSRVMSVLLLLGLIRSHSGS